MMFDLSSIPDRRPEIDRDAVALALQKRLGRPLTWSEYVRVWNRLTKYMWADDFLQ